jgi:hypothetical protein
MRVLSNAIRDMYVEFPRLYRRTIKDSGLIAILIARDRLSYFCELVKAFFLKTVAVTFKVSPVKRLCKISVVTASFRILHAYSVAFGARKLVNLLDNVFVTSNIYRILVRIPFASFCRILKRLKSSLKV